MEKENLYMSFFREIDTKIYKEYINVRDGILDNNKSIEIYYKWLFYLFKKIKRAINNDVYNYQLWKIVLGTRSLCNVLSNENYNKFDNLRNLSIKSLCKYAEIEDTKIKDLQSFLKITGTDISNSHNFYDIISGNYCIINNNYVNTIIKNIKIQIFKIYNKIFDIILFTTNHFIRDIIKNHYLKDFKDSKINNIKIYFDDQQFISILDLFKIGILFDYNSNHALKNKLNGNKSILTDFNSFADIFDIEKIFRELIVNLIYDYKFYSDGRQNTSFTLKDIKYAIPSNNEFLNNLIFEGLIDFILCDIDGKRRMFLIQTYFNKLYLKEINEKYPFTLFDALYMSNDCLNPLSSYFHNYLYEKYNRYIRTVFDYELDYKLNGNLYNFHNSLYRRNYNFYIYAHRYALSYMVSLYADTNYSNKIKNTIFSQILISKVICNLNNSFINNNKIISFDVELLLEYNGYYIYPSITINDDKYIVKNLYIAEEKKSINNSTKKKILDNIDKVYEMIKNIIIDLYNEAVKECNKIDEFFKNISENEIGYVYFNGDFNQFIIEMKYYYNKFTTFNGSINDELINITIDKFSTINKYRNLFIERVDSLCSM